MRHPRLPALLLAALFLLQTLLPVTAAAAAQAEDNTVHIRSIADLDQLAQHCVLNTWSRGRTVVLDADLNLTGHDFTPIPVFCGIFDGQDHTITGVKLRQSGSMRGLFRLVEAEGTVQNLNVRGSYSPTGEKDSIGGIAGVNRGTIRQSTFAGTIHGGTSVGGIAGVNGPTGTIVNCTFYGTLTGEHEAGGIAGTNQGSLLQCLNMGSINITEVKAEVSLADLSLDQIGSTQLVPASTDIGGIAGYSTGILETCDNSGNVGYPHTGYNIGGVVGRQSGSLEGCTSSGTVLGRKDIGGIAGQLEPQVTMLVDDSQLEQLWTELDTLKAMIDQTMGDASGNSHALNEQLSGLNSSILQSRDALSSLSDALSQWADSGITQLEDLSARISWTLEQVVPIMEDIESTGEGLKTALALLGDALEEASTTGELAGQAGDALLDAVYAMQAALEEGHTAITQLLSGLHALREGLGSTEALQNALEQSADSILGLGSSFSDMTQAVEDMKNALLALPGNVIQSPQGQQLIAALDQLQSALEDIGAAQEEIRQALQALAASPESQEALQDLARAMSHLANASLSLYQANQNFTDAALALGQLHPGAATGELLSGLENLGQTIQQLHQANTSLADLVGQLTPENVKDYLDLLLAAVQNLRTTLDQAKAALRDCLSSLAGLLGSSQWQGVLPGIDQQLSDLFPLLDSMGESIGSIGSVLEDLAASMDPAQIEAGLNELGEAVDHLDGILSSLSQALDDIDVAMQLLDLTGDSAASVLGALAEAAHAMDAPLESFRQAISRIRELIQDLADEPSIVVDRISDVLAGQQDSLDRAFTGLMASMESVNAAISSTSDGLLTDFTGINQQMETVLDALRLGIQGDGEEEDLFEDVSDQESGDRNGHITSCRNTGQVEGDVNVAGITGSMALDSTLDPEGDLLPDLQESMNFRWQARAVVRSCVNDGEITVKTDYGGGITGRMDLGSIGGCESYGSISSPSGDFIGGIAGSSSAIIRDSWVRCSLSGGNWIGGVAGSGGTITDCRTLVEIDQGESCLGTIAGSLTEGGSCKGNAYVHDSLGGVDGISYAGECDPVEFDTLITLGTAPEAYTRFQLTLVADGKVVEEIPFQYGDSLDSLPPVPEKEGCTGTWPDIDLSRLTFSRTLEAQYSFLQGSISDGSNPPQVVAEGTFREGSRLSTVQKEDQSWTDTAGATHRGTLCALNLDDSDTGETGSYTLHWRLEPGQKNAVIWLQTDSGWQRVKTVKDGSYLLFPGSGARLTFGVEPSSPSPLVWILPALGLLVLLLLLVLFLRGFRKRKAKKHPHPAPEDRPQDAAGPMTGPEETEAPENVTPPDPFQPDLPPDLGDNPFGQEEDRD